MSEDDTDDETEVSQPPADEVNLNDSENDRPELDDDETASFDPGDLEDVADEIDEMEDDQEDAGDREDDSEAFEDDDTGGSRDIEELSLSWGDLYVDTLATLLVVVVEEYGDAPDIDEEEIVSLAQSGMIDISAAVDQLVVEMGGPTELAPEYAVVLGTALLAFAVLAKETDVLKDALGGESPLGGAA